MYPKRLSFQTVSSGPCWARGFWVLGASVCGELFVTLGFESLFHFVECFTTKRTRRLKHPCAFGATEACEFLALNPNQPGRHCRIISCKRLCKNARNGRQDAKN
jgi:hypothetical protein